MTVAHGDGGIVLNNVAGAAYHGQSLVDSTGVCYYANSLTVSGYLHYFTYAAGAVGSITVVGNNGTAFNTSSDGRRKDDFRSFDAGRIIDQTEVFDFHWKGMSEDARSLGVIAQEAAKVYAGACHYHEEGDWWGTDYSKYVPVLLQELKTLRRRVAALEGMT